MMFFVREHLFFGTSGAAPFLTTNLFGKHLTLGLDILILFFETLAEFFPRMIAVHLAGPFLLAFDLDAGRNMLEIHAGRGLVDLLSPATRTENKFSDQVFFFNPYFSHTGVQGIELFF